jgi:excisionase family DNA binding protein
MTRRLDPELVLAVSIEDAAEMLSLSRQKVYELIAREGLPVVRFGKSVRVPVADLKA